MQRIVVVKEYTGPRGDLTVLGVMTVDADTPTAAATKVAAEMVDREKPLQTTDPRILWDTMLADIYAEDYEYVDFSFDVLEDYEPDDVDAEHSHDKI